MSPGTRGSWVLAVVCFGIVITYFGCSDEDGASFDLAVVDASGPWVGDLPVGLKVGCHGMVACGQELIAQSGASATQAETMCSKLTKRDSGILFDSTLACLQGHCVGYADAGTAKCVPIDGGFVNEDGTPTMTLDPGTGQKRCGACLADATAKLLGKSCAQPAGPDCDPAECAALLDACLADTP